MSRLTHERDPQRASVIMTYDSITDEAMLETPRQMDLSLTYDRKWLASHVSWAVNNGKIVEIMSLADWDRLQKEEEDG